MLGDFLIQTNFCDRNDNFKQILYPNEHIEYQNSTYILICDYIWWSARRLKIIKDAAFKTVRIWNYTSWLIF